ncbi:MAG TPA: nucleoside triphosphate pyrophosphohydrolase [Roseiflexaceae bacterium]|nr:nucleoside triphosphate pyrophosphohydrolase [Roseiflexaceae bacterium]
MTFDSIAAACGALGLDPLERGLQLLDARALLPAVDVHPGAAPSWAEKQGVGPYRPPLLPFPLLPTRPALLCRVAGLDLAALAAALLERYPPDHPLDLVVPGQAPAVRRIALGELVAQTLEPETCLYLVPLAPLRDLRGPEGPALVAARLLGPDGCPWDREQTHRSLRKDLLEETHEVLEAIDADNAEALAEELGDLLLQVLMHSEMARQAGSFDLGVVYEQIASKLIRRHPHVFGSADAADSGAVLRNWDAIKREERAAKGQAPRGALDGVPSGLPALAVAQTLTRKAAKAGFDAPDAAHTWAKLDEEIGELRAALEEPLPSAEARLRRVEEELGDLLLISAKLAWKLGVDAESALRAANAKFRRRFALVEQALQAQGSALTKLSIEERIALWEQVKQHEHTDQDPLGRA